MTPMQAQVAGEDLAPTHSQSWRWKGFDGQYRASAVTPG
jgi:hypothetical protein